jgi:CDP-diacylglycerol--glycerol-3-phosphate 3-phosphatidyltransferase
MTFASKITLARILLVPVFAVLAIYYGDSVAQHAPREGLRWAALVVFVTAAASDGIDGWIARRFNQRSKFGAIIDPIADKSLLLTAFITLTVVDWGPDGWRLPVWFTALVIVRECIILGGINVLHFTGHQVAIAPQWSGKICTVAQMFTLGWIMLKVVPFSPLIPCVFAALCTVWSGVDYVRQGLRILHQSPHPEVLNSQHPSTPEK